MAQPTSVSFGTADISHGSEMADCAWVRYVSATQIKIIAVRLPLIYMLRPELQRIEASINKIVVLKTAPGQIWSNPN